MSRKSVREIERDLEKLEPAAEDNGGGTVIQMGKSLPDLSESPHPELTVRPYPQTRPDMFQIASPNVWPSAIERDAITFVDVCTSDVTETWPGDSGNDLPRACELWDAMTDEELRAEYEYRSEQGEPIPEVLEPYAEE